MAPVTDRTTIAIVTIYVDEILCIGPTEVVQGPLAAIGLLWKCTGPQFLSQGDISFNGYELMRSESGDLIVNQRRYVQELLSRYLRKELPESPGDTA